MRKKYPLPRIIFEATRECNLRCVYCYNHWRRTDAAVPPSDFGTASRTIDKLLTTVDFGHITFTGGEPLLADGLFELILKCRMRKKEVTLISNGTPATAPQYRLLHSMGVSLFELPLHSPDPAAHDDLTTVPGTFSRVVSSITTLASLGAHICTVFVMTKRNIGLLEETLRFAESLDVSYFMLARFNIGGRGIVHRDALLPTLGQLANAFAVANEFAGTHRMNISANVCLPRCIINPAQFPRLHISACSSHISQRPVTVDFEGNVRMCNHSPNIMGNIHKMTMESILSSDYARLWQTARPPLCADCGKWSDCGGGCRAAAEQCGGTLFDEDPVIALLDPAFKKNVVTTI